MIIVRLTGGLGNQMFQYAFGNALAIKRGVQLKLDVSLLGENEEVSGLVVRHFDLDVFPLSAEFVTPKEIEDFNGKSNPTVIDRVKFRLNKTLGRFPLIIQDGHRYDESQILGIGKEACIAGRWQSELYFKGFESAVREDFSFATFTPNSYSSKVAEEIEKGVSVAVHVRRGDYTTHPVYAKAIGTLDKQYYLDAISYMRNKLSDTLKFFFISDDIEWCKNTFASTQGAVFVEQEKGRMGYFSDLWLLSRCKHSIISNSTFSWWGAWLGEKKDSIVIAPGNWAKDPSYRPQNIIPERWVKLRNSLD